MKKEFDISVILLIERDYATETHTFEALGFEYKQEEGDTIGVERKYGVFVENTRVELVVGLSKDSNDNLQKTFVGYADRLVYIDCGINKAQKINALVRECSGDKICFVSPNVFAPKQWLTDLNFYHKLIPKTGLVGLADSVSQSEYLPIFSTEDEKSVKVFIPNDNCIETHGLFLTTRQNFYFVGALDTSPEIAGYEWTHWQMRAISLGLTNFYIPTLPCMVANKEALELAMKGIEYKGITAMKKSLGDMKKMRNFYIPL